MHVLQLQDYKMQSETLSTSKLKNHSVQNLDHEFLERVLSLSNVTQLFWWVYIMVQRQKKLQNQEILFVQTKS